MSGLRDRQRRLAQTRFVRPNLSVPHVQYLDLWYPFADRQGKTVKEVVSGFDASWTSGAPARSNTVLGPSVSILSTSTTDAQISVPGYSNWQDNWTLSMWVIRTNTGGDRRLLGMDGRNIEVFEENEGVRLFNGSAQLQLGTNNLLGVGVPQCIHVTYDNESVVGYVNGREVGSGSIALSPSSLNGNTFYLGAISLSLAAHFAGHLIDYRIYQGLTMNARQVLGSYRDSWSLIDVPDYYRVRAAAVGSHSIPVPQGNLALSAEAPIVVVTENRDIPVPQSNLVLDSQPSTADVSDGIDVFPLQGNLALSTTAAERLLATLRTVPPGDLVIDGKVPTANIESPGEIIIPKGDLVLDGSAPSRAIGSTRDITVPQGNMRLQQLFYPVGVNFDGTNDRLVRGADLTGGADSKQVTGSVWFKTSNTGFLRFYTAGSIRFEIFMNAQGRVGVTGDNSSGTVILSARSVSTYDDGGWHHMAFSFDLADANSKHLYIDGKDDLNSITHTDDTLDLTTSDHALGGPVSGSSNFWDGDLADFWFDQGVYIDLSSNLEKFWNIGPVDLGSSGQLPTGTSPILFFSGAVSTWHTNKGTGGGFTEEGELTRSPDLGPSDHTPQVTTPVNFNVPQADLVLSTEAPDVQALIEVIIPQGDLVLSTEAPLAVDDTPITVPQGDLTLSTDIPLAVFGVIREPLVANLAISSEAVIIDATTQADIVVPAGSIVISSEAPTVRAIGWQTIDPDTTVWTKTADSTTFWTKV